MDTVQEGLNIRDLLWLLRFRDGEQVLRILCEPWLLNDAISASADLRHGVERHHAMDQKISAELLYELLVRFPGAR